MGLKLSILYRGPLASCNYDCAYCPFAKRQDDRAALTADRVALDRFVGWVARRSDADRIGVLFTPWGEALTRRWYRDALVRLTRLPQVVRAAVQTNLSCGLDWIDACERGKLALWATYHPGQVARTRFVAKCLRLHARGVRFSVGVVGLPAHLDEIDTLRRELPADVYLWVNAYKRDPNGYQDADVQRLGAVDPLFDFNNQHHASAGQICHAGHRVISVDGDGTMRRCHFIRAPIGNLYAPGFEQALQERRCTNATCGCHIGYVHLAHLNLTEVFGDGILERIPAIPVQRRPAVLPLGRDRLASASLA